MQRAQEESASALATTQHQLDTNNQEWTEKLARMTAQVGNSGLIVTVLQKELIDGMRKKIEPYDYKLQNIYVFFS